ncbi:MAG TPA: hypothetical protein VK458_23440, partial [Myxococcaceae bacterium]|nr:hypothetical protein [Myxococcaceae bacterium]
NGADEGSIARRLERVLLEKANLRLNPAHVRAVAEFPLNAAAKIDRRASTEWLGARRDVASPSNMA